MKPRRPGTALAAALICLVSLVLTGVIALIVPVAVIHDAATLHGFTALSDRPRLGALAFQLAHSVDPSRYVVFVAALAVIALIRGRRRLALAVPVAMLGASATTELLKPLVGNVRHSEWLSAVSQIGAASWPSGHATAAMMVALCGVLVAPPVLRPLAALLGTGLAVGVSYSILVLGWHFPSDVLGGFLVAGTWVSATLAVLWSAEARWPVRAARPAARAAVARDLVAPAVLLATTFGGAVTVLAVRGQIVESYGAAHLSFVAGALAIAALAAVLATAVTVALRR